MKLNSKKIENVDVASVISSYPAEIIPKIMKLRSLIIDAAAELEVGNQLMETLKWGEPSYLAPQASTIRIAWRPAKPAEYGLFFNCKTVIIETINEIYPSQFNIEGKRGLLFNMNEKLPAKIVKHCIVLALTYHTRKKLPLLGGCPV